MPHQPDQKRPTREIQEDCAEIATQLGAMTHRLRSLREALQLPPYASIMFEFPDRVPWPVEMELVSAIGIVIEEHLDDAAQRLRAASRVTADQLQERHQADQQSAAEEVTATTLMHPTIHSNGSGVKNLLDRYQAVKQALEQALAALALSRPNIRDYYTKPEADSDIKLAEEQHRAREKKVEAVREQMMELIRPLGQLEVMRIYRARQIELEAAARLEEARGGSESSS